MSAPTTGADGSRGPEAAPGSGSGAGAGSKGSDVGSLARGGALNIAGAAISALAQLVVVAVITNAFSQDEAGILFAATSAFLLVGAVCELGTQTSLVYFIARFRSLGRTEWIGPLVRLALRPMVLFSAVLGVALFAAAPWVAEAMVHGDSGDGVTYLRVLAVFLPVMNLSAGSLAATQGFRRMRPAVLIENIGRPLAQLAAVGAVAAAGASGLIAVAWVGPYLPAAVLAVLAMVAMVRRTAPAGGAAPDVPPDLGRRFWSYALPRGLAGITQIMLQRMDILLVASMLGARDAAIYTAASRLRVVGQLANQAISQAVQPQLSEVLAHDDRRSANTLYQTATSWLMLANWPLFLLAVLFAEQLLRLFGQGYHDGAPVIVVLAVAMLLRAGTGMVEVVLMMAGKTTWNLANIVLALGVNVCVSVLLIPHIGIMGAALGNGAALLARNVVPLLQLRMKLGLHPFGRGSLAAAALAGVCFGAIPLVVRLTAGDGLPELAAAAAIGTAGYVAGCYLLRRPLRLDEAARSILRRGGRGGGGHGRGGRGGGRHRR
ncbi:oligosaccharide flippase family protein [Actinomadura soli]|uniref:oligosaccharide flippase family protein n=1 Tax=Actinomadura soli TaxID=2508997 RepID=UPI0014875B5D|nr:polysaccharide biosynthesis C-terminal domain-containing protein [Actinomadura soli]